MEMKLDLDALTKSADNFESTSTRGGKYSAIYNELDTAFDIIYKLRFTQKAVWKEILKLLQLHGMGELKEHNLTGWWNSKRTKAKVEKRLAEEKRQAEVKERTKAKPLGIDIAKKPEPAPAVEPPPQVEPEVESNSALELGIPLEWKTFVSMMKDDHEISVGEVREALENLGMIYSEGRTTYFTRSNPYFSGVTDWQEPINFAKLSVGSKLVDVVKEHIG